MATIKIKSQYQNNVHLQNACAVAAATKKVVNGYVEVSTSEAAMPTLKNRLNAVGIPYK